MVPSTPGLRYLAGAALSCAVPVTGGVAMQLLLNRALDVYIPNWVVIFGSLAILPVVAGIRVFMKEWRDRRDAAAMGAQIVPKVRGKLFGNIDVIRKVKEAWMTGYPGDELDDFFAFHGSMFNIYAVYSDLFFTMSPEHLKLMLANDFTNFVKGERLQETLGSVLGSGVLNSDGDMWMIKVKTTNNFPDFIGRLPAPPLLVTALAITKSSIGMPQSPFLNLKNASPKAALSISRFTLDSATEFLFGSYVHSLTAGLAGLPYPHNVAPPSSFTDSIHAASSNAFAKALLQAQEVIARRERSGPIWPLEEIWQDRTRKSMQIVDEYIEPIIQEVLERKKTGKFDKVTSEQFEEGETLLDHLVQVTEDPKVLKDELLNILIASRDTTAATLTFTVYLLAMHPQVMTRLRVEILDTVGPIRMPNEIDIKDMKYLRAVINGTSKRDAEAFPAVPFNERESVDARVWPNPDPAQKPYYIPAKTKILFSVFMMQRRTDLWGPDALEFDPDRFLGDRVNKYLAKNAFIFLPFNAGPRTCLGQQFAYNEISIMLVRLLQSFSSVVLDPESAPPNSLPPASWKKLGGRKAIEQVVPKVHLNHIF